MTLRKGRGRVCGWHRGRAVVCDETKAVQEDEGQSVTVKRCYQISKHFLAGFVQLSPEATVSVHTSSAGSEGRSTMSGHSSNKIHFWSVRRRMREGFWRSLLRGMISLYG